MASTGSVRRHRGTGGGAGRGFHPPRQCAFAGGADRTDGNEPAGLWRLRAAAGPDLRASHPHHRAADGLRTRGAPGADPGRAGAPDRHGRDPEGDRQFAVGRAAGVRRHRAQRRAAVRPQDRPAHDRRRWPSASRAQLRRHGRRVSRARGGTDRPAQRVRPGRGRGPGRPGRGQPRTGQRHLLQVTDPRVVVPLDRLGAR